MSFEYVDGYARVGFQYLEKCECFYCQELDGCGREVYLTSAEVDVPWCVHNVSRVPTLREVKNLIMPLALDLAYDYVEEHAYWKCNHPARLTVTTVCFSGYKPVRETYEMGYQLFPARGSELVPAPWWNLGRHLRNKGLLNLDEQGTLPDWYIPGRY
jgi:hypothetical protein